MAGIGFELQKLVKRGSYLSYFQAFLVGTVLSSGPWLTTTASLLVLGLYTTFALQASTARLIVATIIYGYAFSLILTGPWQNVLTRHVADKVFEKRPTEILPGLRTAGVIIFALSLVVAAPAAAFARISAPVDNPVLFRVAAIALFVVLSELWLLMSYVSTSKTYGHVALSFLSGCAVSLALALLAARYGSASLALLGYGAGQLLIAASLAWQGQREYPGKGWWQTEYFAKIVRYLPVALAGLFYNAGIWADKVILWITMGTPQGASLLRTYAPYDVPTFLAFLSMVPALTWFLVAGETTFYRSYRTFVDSILHGPLVTIHRARDEVYEVLRQTVGGMAKFQGIFTLAAFVLAGRLLTAIGYGWVSTRLFRLLLLGAYANVLYLNVLILMLYLELRKEAAWCSFCFFLANASFTLACTALGEGALGWNYLLAAITGLAASWFILDDRASKIDYHLYVRQVAV